MSFAENMPRRAEANRKKQKIDYEKNLEKIRELRQKSPEVFRIYPFLNFELKKLIDADKESFDHTQRVFETAVLVADEMLDEIDGLYLKASAVAHDIGKSDREILAVVQKEGEIDENDFDILKNHTKKGCDICKQNNADMVGDIVVRSHEHQGEKSYPRAGREDRRKNEREGFAERRKENPVADKLSRMLAIIDVFDALINERRYKSALNFEEVMAHINNKFTKEEDRAVIDLITRNYKKENIL